MSDGFTLLELMITLAIVGILMVIAVPKYEHYLRRAHFTEVVQACAPYKLGVAECFSQTSVLTHCDAASNGVPPVPHEVVGMVQSVRVRGGVITVTPIKANGLTPQDTYVLTPSMKADQLLWHASGGGVERGYAH